MKQASKPPSRSTERPSIQIDVNRMIKLSVFFSLLIGLSTLLGTQVLSEPGWERLNAVSIFLFILALALWLFLWRGYYRLLTYSMILGYGAAITYGALTGVGVRGSAFTAFSILVILAALLIHRRAGYIVAGAAALLGLGLVWAEEAQVLPNINQPLPALVVWINASTYFLIAAALLEVTMRQVERAFSQQACAEDELRRLNAELETRIEKRTAQLAESEARYRLITEYASDVIWVTDLNLILTYVSPSVERARGFTVEEALRQPTRQALTPTSFEKAKRLYDEEMANPTRHQDPGYTRLIELEYTRKDGSTYWCEVKLSFLRDQTGTPIGIVGVARDIDARKKAEQALRANEERYRLISTLSSDYAFSTQIHPDGTLEVEWVTGAFETITGYSIDVYKAKGGWRAILHPESLERDHQAMAMLNTNHPVDAEMKIITANGDFRWLRFYAHPVWDTEQNRLAAIHGAGKDITAQKMTEAREIRRREMLEKIILLGQTVTQHTDLQSCLRQIHHSLRYELGFDRIGVLLYDAVKNEFHDAFSLPTGDIEDSTWYLRAKSEHETWNMVMKTPKGLAIIEEVPSKPTSFREKTRPIRQHATLAAWAGDKPVALIAVDNARTREPLTEEKLEALKLFAGYAGLAIENARLNGQLEQRVTERTAELEAANRELQDFTYTIAHDLRAPARAMIGFSRLLQEHHAGNLNPEGQHYLNRVNYGAQRMGKMIDELLAFTRLGRQTLHKREVNMRALARQVLEEFQPEQIERQITVDIEPLPDAFADQEMVEQIWLHLLANAFKFTRGIAEAKITLGAGVRAQVPYYFVRDNGVGFEMQYAEKLFGVFHRLHREEEYEGTGMGLAIVHRIVTRHGGQVWTEAELNKGATFFFTLGTTP